MRLGETTVENVGFQRRGSRRSGRFSDDAFRADLKASYTVYFSLFKRQRVKAFRAWNAATPALPQSKWSVERCGDTSVCVDGGNAVALQWEQCKGSRTSRAVHTVNGKAPVDASALALFGQAPVLSIVEPSRRFKGSASGRAEFDIRCGLRSALRA